MHEFLWKSHVNFLPLFSEKKNQFFNRSNEKWFPLLVCAQHSISIITTIVMTSYLWISTHERQSASIHNNKYVSLFKGKLSRMCSVRISMLFYDVNWRRRRRDILYGTEFYWLCMQEWCSRFKVWSSWFKYFMSVSLRMFFRPIGF